MAITRLLEEQIENATVRGIPTTVGPGAFLTLAEEVEDNQLVIFDFTRVPLPSFTSTLNRRWNSTTITIQNDSGFEEYCTHLVVMSADDEPLLVIDLPSGDTLSPGESLTLPPFSVNIREFEDLINRSNLVFDSTILPYRAVAGSSISLQLDGESSGTVTP